MWQEILDLKITFGGFLHKTLKVKQKSDTLKSFNATSLF